ncbi:MAG: TatD family hydrolase [Chloroflexi bacterium]|nr:TatD family hydrolase [Chloroflexota bacterium]
MIIDTHAHLDQPEFENDVDEVIRRAQEVGVEAIVSIGLDVASSRSTIALAERYEIVWATVGVHPHYAATFDEATMDELRSLARHSKVVAIGETGLDYYRMRAPRDAQIKAFEGQLTLAKELGIPVIVHDRDAHDDAVAILRKSSLPPPEEGGFAGVLHCFSGDVQMAFEGISRGFAISIAGPVTYPKAERLADVVRSVPVSALVVETDSPFLTPQRFRGRRNEPAYVRFVVEQIAQLCSEPVEAIAFATSDNARRLFRF